VEETNGYLDPVTGEWKKVRRRAVESSVEARKTQTSVKPHTFDSAVRKATKKGSQFEKKG